MQIHLRILYIAYQTLQQMILQLLYKPLMLLAIRLRQEFKDMNTLLLLIDIDLQLIFHTQVLQVLYHRQIGLKALH